MNRETHNSPTISQVQDDDLRVLQAAYKAW